MSKDRIEHDLETLAAIKERVAKLEPGSQIVLHSLFEYHVLVIVDEDPEWEESNRRMDVLRQHLTDLGSTIEVHLMGRQVYEQTKDVPGTLAYWLAWRDVKEHTDMMVQNVVEHGRPDPESSLLARTLTVTGAPLHSTNTQCE